MSRKVKREVKLNGDSWFTSDQFLPSIHWSRKNNIDPKKMKNAEIVIACFLFLQLAAKKTHGAVENSSKSWQDDSKGYHILLKPTTLDGELQLILHVSKHNFLISFKQLFFCTFNGIPGWSRASLFKPYSL